MLNHRPPAAGRATIARVRQSAELHRLTGSAPEFLVSPFSRREQSKLTGLVLLWVCTVILLFWWWFQRDHVIDWPSFAIASLALIWVVCLPGYFFFFLLRARVPNPRLAIGSGWRVAMVVTKVPRDNQGERRATIRMR